MEVNIPARHCTFHRLTHFKKGQFIAIEIAKVGSVEPLHALSGLAAQLLPPNVYMVEYPYGADLLRAKVAVMSLASGLFLFNAVRSPGWTRGWLRAAPY